MQFSKITAAAAAASIALLGLAACGSSDGGDTGTGGSAGGESVKVGIKFDQPGLGLKTGSTYSGFDIPAGALRRHLDHRSRQPRR